MTNICNQQNASPLPHKEKHETVQTKEVLIVWMKKNCHISTLNKVQAAEYQPDSTEQPFICLNQALSPVNDSLNNA